MGQPYVGEIRLFGGNFAPAGWMTCDGQLLAISQYDVLFQLIGTTYGGDGVTTFALPNLAARVPIHQGSNGTTNYNVGDNGGVTSVTLTLNQIPVHTHPAIASSGNATTVDPTNAFFAATNPNMLYSNTTAPLHPPNLKILNAATLPPQGGSQPHDNMQPYLAITYIISMFGIYPAP
jgi:microcystin-dependent protein